MRAAIMSGHPAKRARTAHSGDARQEKNSPDGEKDLCVMAPRCSGHHPPARCPAFPGLPWEHGRVLAKKHKMCLRCLSHTTEDTASARRCAARRSEEHRYVCAPEGAEDDDSDTLLPAVQHEEGRDGYNCRMAIRVRDPTKPPGGVIESFNMVEVLFDPAQAQTVIRKDVAARFSFSYAHVPPTSVLLPDGQEELSTKLYFLDLQAVGKKPAIL